MQTKTVHLQWHKVELPLALRAGEVWSTGLPIQTPFSPGEYRLRLDMPTLGLKTSPKLVQVSSNAYQTSANASQSLSAAYVLEEPRPGRSLLVSSTWPCKRPTPVRDFGSRMQKMSAAGSLGMALVQGKY